MKRCVLILSLLYAVTLPASAQDDAGMSEKIALVINAGNAHELAKLLNANVDLNIPGNEGVYSKAQAELILKEFFSKNNPQNYKTLHKGASKDGAVYAIGNLQTDKGLYRAYFYMKKKEDAYLIHELSLSSDNKDE